MKENELRKVAKCVVCGKGFLHTGLPLFWRVRIERLGVDTNVVRRQDGLAAMLGNSMLANVMGPDEEMTKAMMDPVELTLCETCAMSDVNIAVLAEIAAEKEPK
jgi:hypothetical protein